MKATFFSFLSCHLALFAGASSLLMVGGCTSTETGNPVDEPVGTDEPLVTTTPVDLTWGLATGTRIGTDAIPGVANFQSTISGVWMRLAEVEFLTCDDEPVTNPLSDTQSNLSQSSSLSLEASSGETCGAVIRTAPLEESADVPTEAIGAGLLVGGTTEAGAELTIALPAGQVAILAPADGSFTAEELEGAHLEFDQAILTNELDTTEVIEGGYYDQETAPRLTAQLAAQFSGAFRLVKPSAADEALIAQGAPLAENPDLLCRGDCSLDARSACGSCTLISCLEKSEDAQCGELYSTLLSCRISDSNTKSMCFENQERLAPPCQTQDAAWRTCTGAP